MNRRTFVLGLGMAACSGASKTGSKPSKPNGRRRPMSDESQSGGVVDSMWFDSQLHASRLAFHRDVLVQSVGNELRSWDTTTMRRGNSWTLTHGHFCFVQDGTIVALGFPDKETSSVIHRIANGKVHSKKGPILPSSGTPVVLPASKPHEIYVAVGENIYRIGATSEVEEILPHPYPNGATRDQWISRGDGRLFGGRNGALFLVAPNKVHAEYPIANRELFHLVAGSGELVWYSYADVAENDAHMVVLATAAKPMTQVRQIDVAPGRVVHLASFGSTLAALLMFMGKGREDTRWKVAVFDETGNERWRVDVPDEFGPKPALNAGFVAIGEHRVVLASPDGTLLAWDAADGKSVGSRGS